MILESEASTASSPISHHTPVRSSPENVEHKKKRRRRRRIENDTPLNGNGDSDSMHILEKASNTTAQESAAVSISSSTTPTSTPLPLQSSQEETTIKKRHRKSRRRRKEVKDTTTKDDVLLSLSPNRTKSTTLQNTISDHKLVESTEELENNNSVTSAILNNESLATSNDGGECEAVKTDDVLLSQSQSNATTIAEEVTAQDVSNAKVTDKKHNITQNKKKTPSNKKPNASKSSTTTSLSTGKEGECLRRIKHEWRNAVKSGIAYDWINMKTIRNTNTANSAYVRIGPFGKNLLRWHFSVAGPANSVYENGIYHGRVLLPKDYPASPPRVQMITPSGRFIPGEDICLSASSYHPETWSPRWTVMSLVDALRLHMLTTANEIGGVLASDEKRRQYAIESRSWKCHGVANHERMVAENIFSLHNLESDEKDDENDCDEEANSDESDIANSNDVSDEVAENHKQAIDEPMSSLSIENEKDVSLQSLTEKKKSKTKKHPNKGKKRKQKSALPSIVSNDEEPTKRTSKKKKSSSKKKSTVTDNQSNDEAPITHTVVKEKKRNRKRATDIKVQERDQNILTIVLKRLLIEMLKLPLRVLAILIRILDRFETYMRAILDRM